MGRVAGLGGGGVNGVLGVDHGDDLVAVQGTGEGVTGSDLIGVALNGRCGLSGHVIGGAPLQAVGGVGRGYGVAILVHEVNGNGVVVDLIGDGGLQEILTVTHSPGAGSLGVEGGAVIGVKAVIALAAIGVIGAVGTGFRLGVHQLHGVVQLHMAEVGDGYVDAPQEVLLTVRCGGYRSERSHRRRHSDLHACRSHRCSPEEAQPPVSRLRR